MENLSSDALFSNWDTTSAAEAETALEKCPKKQRRKIILIL